MPATSAPSATGSCTADRTFTAPVLVDDAVVGRIEDLVHLAPLHNPPAVEGIRHARESYPDVPQVAVFDTAFFAALPAEAATYALDRTTTDRLGIRRYGMHGTSHAYVAHEAARVPGRVRSRSSTRSCCTSATARPLRRSGAVARSTPRWASPRWRAW